MTKNIHDNYNLSNHWLNTLQENSPLRAIIDEYPDKQDRDVVYLSALTLFSSCMPNYTGWWNGNEFTTHMFSFFVGKSATSKSKATVLQGILDDIDDDLRASSQKKINEYNSFTDEQKAQENRPFCEKINFNPDLTSASLFKDLRANEDHGGIIVSSEASHLGASMQGEHGKKLSSYIRNCFSHEVVGKSLSQDDFDVRIKSPKLAILLAGTPGQLQDFIGGKNAENGLIGRFLFRRTFRPKNLKFKASLKIGSGLCDDLKSYANSFYNDFKNAKISFRMHPEDLSYYEAFCHSKMEEMKKINEDYVGVMMRQAIIGYRIMMILTAFRQRHLIATSTVLTCHNEDLLHTIAILNNLITHTLDVMDLIMPKGKVFKPTKLSVLNELPKEFRSVDYLNLAATKNVPGSTAKKWLFILLKNNIVAKNDTNRSYEKVIKEFLTYSD